MNYWEKRALARQAVYDRKSAKTLRTVSLAYDRMVRQLHEDTEKIIGNFAKFHGLTKAEAIELLKQPAPKAVLDDLKARAATVRDPKARQMLDAKLNAPAYASRISRLQAIRESARTNAVQAADVENTVGQVHLRDVLFEGYDRTMFDVQQYTGLGFGFSGVDSHRMNQILRYNWSGKQFSLRVWHNAGVTAQTLSHALTEVIMQGKTSRQTFDELMEQANGSRFAANRLLRTETNYITNQATAEAYRDAGIEKYRFMAVLDMRTSPMCQEKDGQVFELAKAEVGVNYPPLHPWCRSTIAPEIDGISREHMKRWARDPQTGEDMKVPRDMTYKEWKAKYVDIPKQNEYNKFAEEVRSLIKNDYNLQVDAAKQSKHVAGTKNYDPTRSTLTADAQLLINLYAGKSSPVRTRNGEWAQRERFEHSEPIGIFRDTNGNEFPTTRGIIHYSRKNGVHVVPATPSKKKGG